MPDLLPGDEIAALDQIPTEENSDDSVQTNAVTTDWRAGSPGVFVTFLAPTTGRVKITTSARFRCGTTDAMLSVGYELRENDSGGTIIQSEAVVRGQNILALAVFGAYAGGADKTVTVTGLTAGQQYWAQLRYQLVNSTSNPEVRARRIRVETAT